MVIFVAGVWVYYFRAGRKVGKKVDAEVGGFLVGEEICRRRGFGGRRRGVDVEALGRGDGDDFTGGESSGVGRRGWRGSSGRRWVDRMLGDGDGERLPVVED